MGLFAKEFHLFELKKASIGIDIGAAAIKAAVLKKDSKGMELLKLVSMDMPFKDGESKEAKETVVASTLERLIKENNLKGKNVYANLPWESLEVKIISTAYVSQEELRKGLRYEAQQHFSFPLENSQLDYMVIDEISGPEGRMLRLLIAACPGEIAEKRAKLLERFGLKPALLGISPMALWRYAEEMSPENKDKTVSLVEVRDSKVLVCIFMKAKLCFLRDITLRQPLSALSYETVEELVTEVGRTLDYYRANYHIERIDCAVLAGEIKVSNLTNILSERLGVPVERANPLKSIRVNKKDIPDYSEENSPAFAASIGFALMSQRDGAINLIPQRFIKKNIVFGRESIPWIMAAFLILTILFMHISISVKEKHLLRERDMLTRRVNEFRQIYNEFSIFENERKEIEARLAFINTKMHEQERWPQIMRRISEIIPDELWLKSIKSQYAKKKSFLELKGHGFSNQAAMEFVSGLKKISYFGEVKLNFVRAEEIARRKVITFEIICQVKDTE